METKTKKRLPRSPVYDQLVADGGWLTSHGLSLMTGLKASSISKSLNRWEREGFLESRERKLALYDPEFRGTKEYRALMDEYFE
jgi:hypothetical protein